MNCCTWYTKTPTKLPTFSVQLFVLVETVYGCWENGWKKHEQTWEFLWKKKMFLPAKSRLVCSILSSHNGYHQFRISAMKNDKIMHPFFYSPHITILIWFHFIQLVGLVVVVVVLKPLKMCGSEGVPQSFMEIGCVANAKEIAAHTWCFHLA